jgi:hypothetical protein
MISYELVLPCLFTRDELWYNLALDCPIVQEQHVG